MPADCTETERVRIPAAGSVPTNFVPSCSEVTTIRLPPGVTHSAPWERAWNPLVGVRELIWFEKNVEDLGAFQGQWIAILGERVVASVQSPTDLREQIEKRAIVDALVVRVPDDVTQREYFIG